MPIVAMPDGAQVSFPDDMPPEQIKGMIASKFPQAVPKPTESKVDSSGPVTDMMAGIIKSLAGKVSPGFSAVTQPMSDFIDTQRERGAHLANIANAANQGNKTGPEALAEGVMNSLVAPIGDVAGAAGSIAGKTAYEMSPQPLQRGMDAIQQKIAPVAEAYQQNLDTYNKQNPRMGDALQAVREAGNLLPIVAPEVRGAIGEAAPKVGTAIKNVGADTAKNVIIKTAEALKPETMLTSDTVKGMARDAYKVAEEKGGILSPEFANKFYDNIEELKPQTLHGKATIGNDVLSQLSQDWKPLRDKPISLQAAQEMDEGLSQRIDGYIDRVTGKLDKEGQKLYDVQTQFRNMINKASSEDIAGGKEGFDSLNKGRAYWSTALRIGDMERILTRAAMTDNPATSIKTGFRTLYNNPSRMRGYNSAEKAAIKRAAQSGVISGTLRTVLGSRLIGSTLGAAMGGAAGGAIGIAAGGAVGAAQSAASRALAATMQRQRANKVIKTISKRVK